MLKAIANEVAACGGRLFYVGGYVRDLYLSQTVQIEREADIDIEVFGLQDERIIGYIIAFRYGKQSRQIIFRI